MATLSRRLGGTALVVALAAVVLTLVRTPLAQGGWFAKISNSTDTATSATYFTCTAAAKNGGGSSNAVFTYPLSDTGSTAADISGNNRPGSFSSAGVTKGVADALNCPRDTTNVVTLDGANGAVYGPTTATAGPSVFSEEVWFRTTSAQGLLLGFGSSRTGTSSQYDRHVYLDTGGHLVFGVYSGGYKTVTSPASYTDGRWHDVIATLSPTAGAALYVDGALVASNASTTSAESNNSGYWHIGWSTLTGWPGVGSFFFKGDLAFASVYPVALTAQQALEHYQAGV